MIDKDWDNRRRPAEKKLERIGKYRVNQENVMEIMKEAPTFRID